MDIAALLQSGVPGMKVTVGALLSAGVTLLVCLVVIRLASRLLRRLIGRTRLDERVQKYALMALRAVMYAVAAILVLNELNVDATSLVALLSVASLGMTLAAEDILGNAAGGLLLLASHPFSIGDTIEADGVCGTVEEITLSRTKLVTADGLTVLLPNKTLSASKLTNYTSLGRRRICKTISASYETPTETVKNACFAALAATENLLPDPPPAVYLSGYGKSAVEYSVYCWAAPKHYWAAGLKLGEELRESFARCGVKMTYDHLNVHLTRDALEDS